MQDVVPTAFHGHPNPVYAGGRSFPSLLGNENRPLPRGKGPPILCGGGRAVVGDGRIPGPARPVRDGGRAAVSIRVRRIGATHSSRKGDTTRPWWYSPPEPNRLARWPVVVPAGWRRSAAFPPTAVTESVVTGFVLEEAAVVAGRAAGKQRMAADATSYPMVHTVGPDMVGVARQSEVMSRCAAGRCARALHSVVLASKRCP